MVDPHIAMHPNKIVEFLGRLPQDFTKEHLISFIEKNDIRFVNFRYVGGDGRLKTLNCGINSRFQLDRFLSSGERVDGSSLFSYIDSGSGDLYVVPRFRTAFFNPFTEVPTVDILCSFYTVEGVPLPSSFENVLQRAHEALQQSTGLKLKAMGELEYYIMRGIDPLYPAEPQKGYHESFPFSKGEALRLEALTAMAQAGCRIKYGHAEVGYIPGEDCEMEQDEIEFLPVALEDAADQIVIARWVLRTVAYRHGVTVSFAPKIQVGHAGNGLHIHTEVLREGRNMLVEADQLTDTARRVIAGYLSLAPSLTAFGNTVPISYLRLSPHQEAPTNVCWGEQNRSALIRIPLGWLGANDMVKDANPIETGDFPDFSQSQTLEFRSPDGSANIHLLLAGLAVAARHGMQLPDALELADKLHVGVNIFSAQDEGIRERLPTLPGSCWESADLLLKDRAIYERDGVFSPVLIDGFAEQLRSHGDRDLGGRLRTEEEIRQLVNRYIHCG
ncbi:MAG: glutamine synthetase [Dehalococcoidia bacterium]|nr:MAG: glutamine synthetase [Dehalococcoidia bacterium]